MSSKLRLHPPAWKLHKNCIGVTMTLVKLVMLVHRFNVTCPCLMVYLFLAIYLVHFIFLFIFFVIPFFIKKIVQKEQAQIYHSALLNLTVYYCIHLQKCIGIVNMMYYYHVLNRIVILIGEVNTNLYFCKKFNQKPNMWWCSVLESLSNWN